MKNPGPAELLHENAELRARLDEAEETLQAIRSGDVDALVMGRQVYTLEGAETPYRIIFEAMNEGAATLTGDGVILYCNRSLAKILCIPLQKLIAVPLREFVDGADRAAFDALVAEATGGSSYGELCLQCNGAPAVPVLLSFSRLETPGGHGFCVVVNDITQRKRIEEAMRRSEAELREAQRVANVGSWWMDPVTNAVVWTEELYRMLGLDPNSAPPPISEHHRLFTPESWQKLCAALPRTRESGLPYELELEMVRASGDPGWMLARGEPVRNAAGVIVGIRGSAQDITQRKQAELALAESERAFRTLAESMPQIVWVTRADGWNTYFNRRWTDYTGMTMEESHGHGWNKPFHPEDRQRAWDAWQNATQNLVTYSLECRLRRADGTYRWWLVRGVPLLDASGKPLKWFGTCTDIHDLKSADSEIRRLNAELEQRVHERTAALEAANQELEAFSYSVSHDLRAPLRAMDGFSKILLTQHSAELSADARDALQIVRNSSQQMGRLIDELLVFSRLSRQELRKIPVAPADLVRECLATLQPEAAGRRIEITKGDLPACPADPGMLKLVWINLLSNALKYSRKSDPARIEIGCRQNGETVYFVRDNGVGFKMAYADKLFGVFQRLHRAEDYEGTGVGLATAKRIVNRHGGRIWAEAEPDKGATFFFTLEPAAIPGNGSRPSVPPIGSHPPQP